MHRLLLFKSLLFALGIGCTLTTSDDQTAISKTDAQAVQALIHELQDIGQHIDSPYNTVEFKDQLVLFRATNDVIELPTFKVFTSF